MTGKLKTAISGQLDRLATYSVLQRVLSALVRTLCRGYRKA